ncbi:MAG: nucleotidyl transferase AbiEii/AbiGii toxin family protein [Terrimicrobiaceae bacterium]
MTWHLDVLPPVQRALWESRIKNGFPKWVLYGGTALALRLGHRESIDFDFFSSDPIEPLTFQAEMALSGEVLQADKNTLTLIHQGVKLSFFGGLTLNVISPPEQLTQCAVASLDDLGACKLAALVNRVEIKDYFDVLALIRHGIPLARLLGCANAVYRGQFPIVPCLKSLTWFEDPKLNTLSETDRQILETAALSVEDIPSIPTQPFSIGQFA